MLDRWPAVLAERGVIDLAERRSRLLHALAERWMDRPPEGFTIAAGITTSAPAVAALLRARRAARPGRGDPARAWPMRGPCRKTNGTRLGPTTRAAARKAIRNII